MMDTKRQMRGLYPRYHLEVEFIPLPKYVIEFESKEGVSRVLDDLGTSNLKVSGDEGDEDEGRESYKEEGGDSSEEE